MVTTVVEEMAAEEESVGLAHTVAAVVGQAALEVEHRPRTWKLHGKDVG